MPRDIWVWLVVGTASAVAGVIFDVFTPSIVASAILLFGVVATGYGIHRLGRSGPEDVSANAARSANRRSSSSE
jgi:hypothetical protein